MDTAGTPDATPVDETHERRTHGQYLYDRWASVLPLYRFVELDTRAYRRRGIEHLSLSTGDTVIDIGCGPGSNFGLLIEAVGPTGQVIGYDYSQRMVEKARQRVQQNAWANVMVEQVDVTESFLHTEFDAAVATISLSAMSDPVSVIERVHEHLPRGGKLFVLDGKLPDSPPASLVNPLLERVFTGVSNWQPDAANAIPPALRSTFVNLIMAEQIPGGIGYVAVVER